MSESLPPYREALITGAGDPLSVVHALLGAGRFSEYLIYQSDHELRLAAGAAVWLRAEAGRLVVSREGQVRASERLDAPLRQAGRMLREALPRPWTVYGYAAFDLAGVWYPCRKTAGHCPLALMVPRTEARITADGVHLRSMDDLDPPRRALEERSAGPRYRPARLAPETGDRTDYLGRVRRILSAIDAGAVQKVVLARHQHAPGLLDTLGTYTLGVRLNSYLRAYGLNMGAVRSVGFSPELMLSAGADGSVAVNPVAGTRPRGAGVEEDRARERELLRDDKELVEHRDTVQAVRETMAEVAAPGSIRVTDDLCVKKFRTVQHLSSWVRARLDNGRTVWDAFHAHFPAATACGADKHSAMAWIDRLEPEPRGLYGGAVGWLDSAGRADMALAIRCVSQYVSGVRLSAGGGIIAASDPEREYEETCHKMATMLPSIALEHASADKGPARQTGAGLRRKPCA